MLTDYRYPGSRSFQDTDLDRKLFFGRDQEKDELLHLILAEKLVVLFAKSGMGKTSLLNAGVVQPLRERGFFPINIRLNDSNLTPLQTVYAAVQNAVTQSCHCEALRSNPDEMASSQTPRHDTEEGVGCHCEALRSNPDEMASSQTPRHDTTNSDSLLQYFTITEFWSQDDTLLTPVLIFDQFEEFFAFHKLEDRQTFITQLAEALKGQAAQPLLKVIIALREDALGQLKDLSAELPDIFRNLFRLDYLPRAQARQAIIDPAQLTDATIGMQAFQYAPDAVDAMLDFLCKQQQKQNTVLTDEVEPAQLQLLCQHVEQKVRKRQTHADAAIVVQKSDLGGERGMQKIVQQFYDRQLKRLRSFGQRRKVRRLCEKGLLSKTNRRLSLAEEDIGRRFRVSPKLLATLIDSRLLRAENRGSGRVYYELSHDTLIAPIRKSQRRHKIKSWSIGIPVTLLLLFTMNAIFTQLQWNYQFVKLKAVCAALPEKMFAKFYYYDGHVFARYGKYVEAEAQFRKAVALNPTFLDAYHFLGYTLREEGKYDEALMQFQKIAEIDPRRTIYGEIGYILELQGKYAEAIDQYQKYLTLKPDAEYIHRFLANIAYQQGKFEEARQWYQTSYAIYEKLSQSWPKQPEYFAERSLMVEKAEQAYEAVRETEQLMNRPFWQHPFTPGDFLSDDRLAVRFMLVTCLLYQQQRAEALKELQTFIVYYRSLKTVNPKWWDYTMLHNVISMSEKLTDADKTLLLKLIDVLQAPKAEGDQKLKELEVMLGEMFKQ